MNETIQKHSKTIQDTVNTSTRILPKHPHITKPTHYKTHTLQNPHITKPTHYETS